MEIPTYDAIALPLLRLLADSKDHHQRELAPLIADEFCLSEEQRTAKLPSQQQTYLRNRIGWASFHLKRAGLITAPRAGVLRITDEGSNFLNTNPARINRSILMQFEPFREYVQQLRSAPSQANGSPASPVVDEEERTPEETIEESCRALRTELASEILERVKSASPAFFEQLVVDLLLKMGYGGSRAEAGHVTKSTGDKGIDGVIDEDRLGLDAVYIQAKKWDNPVGEPAIRDFVGALHFQRARKGVFMTTSEFTEPARQFIERVDFKISLIDGKRLSELMIDYGVGVSLAHSYEIKKVDNDYFTEE